MLKSNKWIFLAISVPFLIIILSYLFMRVPIGNTGYYERFDWYYHLRDIK